MDFKFLKKVEIENEYSIIYKNIITNYTNVYKYTKNNKVDKKLPFIGSQPIQILKDDITVLLDTNVVISPKIDGYRMLMIVNENGFNFINRAGEFFRYYNDGVDISDSENKWKGSEMLILDTEIYEENGFLQIFVFDILFGQKRKELVVKIYKEQYHTRYKILIEFFTRNDTLIHHINSLDPNLRIYHKLTIPYYNSFDNTDIETYKYIIDKWKNMYNFNDPLYARETPTFDGIIIINNLYRYFLGPSVQYGQYKWKPHGDLTVDLMYSDGKLVDNRGEEWIIPEINKTATSMLNKTTGLENGLAYEFKFDNKELKNIKGPREKGANAIMTLNRVYNAIKNPVVLDDISKMWRVYSEFIEKPNLSQSSKLPISSLQWLSKNKAIMFSLLYSTTLKHTDSLTFTPTEYGNIFTSIIDTYDKKQKELMIDRKPESELLKKAMYYDTIIEYSQGVGKLELSGNFDNILDTLDMKSQQSKKVPITSSFDIILDISRQYETGYKLIRNLNKNIKETLSPKELNKMDLTRFTNIGLTMTNARDLLYKLKKHQFRINEEIEIEYVSKVEFTIKGKTRTVTENYTYEYNKHLPDGSDTKYTLKYIEPARKSFFDIENDTLRPFTGFGVSFMCFETKRMQIEGDRKMLRNPDRLTGIIKKRHKEIHTVVNATKYYNLRITIMKEFKKVDVLDDAKKKVLDSKGNIISVWSTQVMKKAFIELVFNYDTFIKENKLYTTTTDIGKTVWSKGKKIVKKKQYYYPQENPDTILNIFTDYTDSKGKPKTIRTTEMIFNPNKEIPINELQHSSLIQIEENKKKAIIELQTDTNIAINKLFRLLF
jgi:hypothetical protein